MESPPTVAVSCLMWGVTGLLAVPFAVLAWSDVSGAGQDLGFPALLLMAAVGGLAAGAVLGGVAGATHPEGSLRWGKRLLLVVAAVAGLLALVTAL